MYLVDFGWVVKYADNSLQLKYSRCNRSLNSGPSIGRKVSTASSITSPLNNPITGWSDPDYHGDYKPGDDGASDPRSSVYTQDHVLGSPLFQPLQYLISSQPDKPSRPRSSTDLISVEPLNIKSVIQDQYKEIQSIRNLADVQCAELTDFFDLYLEEIMTDDHSKGARESLEFHQ
jgi:hypothetical protein